MEMDLPRLAEVRPREALRFDYVDEQGWDQSCGYAALATLLSRFRNVTTDEADLVARSAGGGEGETVVKVSLGELVRLARDLGLTARPWKLGFDRLGALLGNSAPLLVHYDRPQGHFALVLSAGPRGVVTADPARGLELLTRDQFLARWSGVVLEVLDGVNPSQGQDLVRTVVKSVQGRVMLVDWALSHPRGSR
jgi:hypothetical protein